MKKFKFLSLAFTAFAFVFALTSCEDKPADNPVDPNPPVDPQPQEPEVVKYTVTFESNGGTAVEKIDVEENKTVALPENPTKEGYRFLGWYIDSACTQAFNAANAITGNVTLYANWLEVGSYSVNFNDHVLGYTLDESYKIKNVTALKGCAMTGEVEAEIEGQTYVGIQTSGKATAIGNIPSNNGIQIKMFGKGTVKLWVQASAEDAREFKITNSKKKVVYSKDCTDTNLFEVVLELEEAETLYVYGTNGFNIFKVDTEWEVTDKGTVTGIEVSSPGNNTFVVGEDFATTGLDVVALYDSGYEEALLEGDQAINYTVDYSKYNKNETGYYEITVNFGEFSDTYYAYNYAIEEFNLDLYYMYKDTENIWGNGALRNVNTRLINFGDEDAFDTSALTISILGSVVNEQGKTKTKTFRLSPNDYELVCEGYNKDVAGTYTVTAKTIFGNPTFDTYVITTKPQIVENVVSVKVDNAYTGVVGAVNEDGMHMFTNINTAIEYITYAEGITDDVLKYVYINEGEYYEKVDVDIPNVTMIGAGQNKTIITFDAANGLHDPKGTPFGTDGSSTFGVRSTATNFTAIGITFDSYYNTLERYQALKNTTSGTQALAIMIQADKAAFYDCGFTGFQDTIEMQGAGRQYFYKCFVSGATDYIFGTNSSCLFEECEILTISNGQTNNGGYITAPKGLNKGKDYTAFGYIFNNCEFTNDGNTTTGTTALGRPWDNGAGITIMNSLMASHIATAAYDGSTQAKRLAAGLNGDWGCATTYCKEYNNTGAGAITESQEYTNLKGETKFTCEIITETEANEMLQNFWKSYTVLCPVDSRYDFTAPDWSKPIFNSL